MDGTAKGYHHGNLKTALVEAGLEIIEAEGLAGLSLRAIAAKVGVSHTAPKNHFGSLRGLLTAIGTEGFRLHAAGMREGVAEASGRKARLEAAMRGYVRFAEAHPHLFQLMFSPQSCDFADTDLIAQARESYAVLADISSGLNWDKALTPGGQQRTEMMLWSMVHGYAMLRINGNFVPRMGGTTPWDIEDILPDFNYLPENDP